jgi:hypothetical protein
MLQGRRFATWEKIFATSQKLFATFATPRNDRRLIDSLHPNRVVQDPSDVSARIGRPGASSSVLEIAGRRPNLRSCALINGNALVRTSGGTQKIGRPAHHLISHSRHARGTSSSTIPSILIHPILLHTPHIHSPALCFSRSPPRDNQLAAMRCHPGDDAPPRPSSGGRPGSSSLPSPGSGDGAPLQGVARAPAPAPCVTNTSASLGARGRGPPATTSSRGGAARLPHGRHGPAGGRTSLWEVVARLDAVAQWHRTTSPPVKPAAAVSLKPMAAHPFLLP